MNEVIEQVRKTMRSMDRGKVEIPYVANMENRKATKEFVNNNRFGRTTKHGDFVFKNEYVLIEGVITVEKLR